MRISIISIFVLLGSVFSAVFSQVMVETITSSFNASGGVAIDDSGTVYVADFGLYLNTANGTKVYKVYDDGTVQEFASGLQGASGNDFDSQGNLFQSNIAGNKLSKITPDCTVSTFATNGIIGPVGVAVADGDTIYVANCGGNSIAKVTPAGASSVWVSSSLLNCPNGLTIDDNGNLYTCNFANGNIIKITPDKQVSVLATLPGGRCGHITYFEGMLYAVARCTHKIYQVTLAGDTTLIAGSGMRGNDDGPGDAATFNHPNGIRAKRVGNQIFIYVNDATSLAGNCTSVPLDPVIIRKITLNPVSLKKNEIHAPTGFELYQNHPNPFNPETTIRYILPQTSNIILKIFDVAGREVKTLIDGTQFPGEKSIVWNGRDERGNPAASGVYFYRLQSGSSIQTQQMLLLR